MEDGHAEAAAGLEHARSLADSASNVLDILKRHERGDKLGLAVAEGQRGGVGDAVVAFRVSLARESHRRRRDVDADDPVTPRSEVAREADLPAADVDRQPAGDPPFGA